MKDIPTRRAGTYLSELIHQGEHVQQDFKFLISDARKIARSISAFANCAGGRLLIGVKDNGTIAGVRNEEDIYVIEQAASLYCSPEQEIEFSAYHTPERQIVIIASVTKSPERPVLAQDTDGKWRAFYRVADENIAAHPLMVRAWRHRASARRTSFQLNGPEAEILRYMRQNETQATPDPQQSRKQAAGTPIPEAILHSGVSRRAAEWAIIRLASLGLVEFIHSASEWHLVIPD